MLGSNPFKNLFLINNSIYDVDYKLFVIDGISPEFNENGNCHFWLLFAEIRHILIIKANLFLQYYKENNWVDHILTPNEMGMQEIRRVLKIEPQSASVKAFDKKPITVGFKTKITEDQKIWVNNFAISQQEIEDSKDKEFKYTSKLNFGLVQAYHFELIWEII